MIIHLRKGNDGPDTLTCVRKDGSITKDELQPRSVYHELAHYAVESSLGFTDGFFGMIEKGLQIEEYELENQDRKIEYSPESYHAEFLASLIQSAVALGKIDMTYVEFMKAGAKDWALSFPELPEPEVLEAIRVKAATLTAEWEALPPDAELTLEF